MTYQHLINADEGTDFGSAFARMGLRIRLSQAGLAQAVGVSEVSIRNGKRV